MTNTIHLDTLKLVKQLRDSATPVEAIPLIQSLSNHPDEVAISAFIEAINPQHPTISAAAVDALISVSHDAVIPLMNAFQSCRDHGVQAYIVQALARIGDVRAVDLLLEVVGVEVANHCQGSVRRIAARGLGKIGREVSHSEGSLFRHRTVVQPIIEKLIWVIRNAEDWALRYAAAVSLQEIGTAEAVASQLRSALIAALHEALPQESELVVQERIKVALENVLR